MKASHGKLDNGQLQAADQLPTPPSPRVRRPKAREWLAREIYLLQVELSLEGKVPGRRRKEILRGLRGDMAAEALDHGMPAVLAGLGKPQALAAQYAEGNQSEKALWNAGAVAAFLALVAYFLVFLSYTLGMLAIANQQGGEFHGRFLMVDVMAFSTAEGMGIGWSGPAALWFPVGLAAVGFILSSRPWRLGRRSARA